MNERDVVIVKKADKRCSICVYGQQFVAGVCGGGRDNNGNETVWALINTIPVGQTRNCFNFLQKALGIAGNKFIYPDEDDTCINLRKFKAKGSTD